MQIHPEIITSDHNNRQPTIDELIPHYYEKCGTYATYDALQSWNVDGHNVAWMRVTATVQIDLTGSGKEGKQFCGYELKCACDFTENIGWQQAANTEYTCTTISGPPCPGKQAVARQRNDELHSEYISRGLLDDQTTPTTNAMKEIVLDLIEKQMQGEYIEGSTGAQFCGGHYNLETLQSIVGQGVGLWPAIKELLAENRIRLNGIVIQTFHERPAPARYNIDDAPVARIIHRPPGQVWAVVPHPSEKIRNDETPGQSDQDLVMLLGKSVLGFGHTETIAKARLTEALKNPRASYDAMYETSFLEHTAGPLGALAVIAYATHQSWLVEAYTDDRIVPEVHTLPLQYPSDFGIDQEDYDRLYELVDRHWPSQVMP